MSTASTPAPREPALRILRGLPGSGKTTWAREYVYKNPWCARVSLDDLRAQIHDSQYSSGNEFVIQRVQLAMIVQLLLCGQTVLVDNTHLQPYAIKQLVNLAHSMGVKDVQVIDFITPEHICTERNNARTKGRVPAARMTWMILQLLTVRYEESNSSPPSDYIIIPISTEEVPSDTTPTATEAYAAGLFSSDPNSR